MTKEELNEMTGAELLRLIVSNINATRESFNDKYSIDELIQIHRMFLLSDWDIYPDEWTKRQVKEALEGIPPQWTKNEKPKYSKKLQPKCEVLFKDLISWQEKTGCQTPIEAGEKIRIREDRIKKLVAEIDKLVVDWNDIV